MKLNGYPPLLETKHLCEITRLSRWQLRKGRADGSMTGITWIKVHKKGRKILATRDSVEAFLTRREKATMRDLGLGIQQ